MNDHYFSKLIWVTGQCARRVVYAFALVYYQDDGCLATQYFMMSNVGVRTYQIYSVYHSLLSLRLVLLRSGSLICSIALLVMSFSLQLLQLLYMLIIRKVLPEIQSKPFVIILNSHLIATIVFVCIALMMISNVYFMSKEFLRDKSGANR